MRIPARLLPLLALGIILNGCFEIEREITLNPDGSGKIVITETTMRMDLMFSDDTKTDPKEALREYAAGVIQSSEGIDVWKDVSYKHVGDDKIYFKGTAYFRDISAVKFSRLQKQPLSVTRNADGTMTVRLAEEEKSEEDEDDFEVDPESLTDAEVQQRADSLKQSFVGQMMILRSMLDGMHDKTTLRLPGTIQKVEGFQQKGNTLSLELTGARLLALVDSLTEDSNFFVESIRNPKRNDLKEMMSRAAYGAPPVAVVRTNNTPLFNYTREVAAARNGYLKLKKTLKITE